MHWLNFNMNKKVSAEFGQNCKLITVGSITRTDELQMLLLILMLNKICLILTMQKRIMLRARAAADASESKENR